MQSSVPNYETLSAVAEREITTPLRTLTLHIPRFHNPDEYGKRRKCSLSKLKRTLREIRELFTGYSVTSTKGWNSDDRVRDSHYRFEMDFLATPDQLNRIRRWKLLLEGRFEQRSIYMKVSDRTTWL
jgi:hypothetical protein